MGCEFLSIKYMCNESPDVGDTTEGNETVRACTHARTPLRQQQMTSD